MQGYPRQRGPHGAPQARGSQVAVRARGSRVTPQADALAQGLGWFSIGLGLVELLAARPMARALGMDNQEQLIRAYGMREIATGIGILTSSPENRAPWIWGRVAGDALDVATLVAAGQPLHQAERTNWQLAMAAVLGVTAVDLACAGMLSAGTGQRQRIPPRDYSGRRGMPRPPEEMRGAARDFEVPRDMRIPDALRPWTSARGGPRASAMPGTG
jgi:hypothetical protein